MKAKNQKDGLNHPQREAIAEAQRGNPIPLERLIRAYETTLIKFNKPYPDIELQRWAFAMRVHYGHLLDRLKQARKETQKLSPFKHAK